MAVTAYKYAGTAANVDRDSKVAWTNPDYAKADDTSYATNQTGKDTYGDWLLLTNFGFTSSDLPSGCTINGIQIIVCRHASASDFVSDNALYLYDDGAVGNNLASATKWPQTTPTEATYGGATDMCGTSLTQADIVASTFGVRLSIRAVTSNEVVGSVNYIKIRVDYTEGGGSTTFLPNIMKHFTPQFIGGY